MRLRFDEAVSQIIDLICDKQDLGQLPIVLIDGRAGAGKSQLAKGLSEAYFKLDKQAARVVAMDDLYPGWEGLSSGSVYLYEKILRPLSQGETASWQVWDWLENKRGVNDEMAGNREFSGGTALIVEGCGSISRLTSEIADLTIWIEADSAIRKARFSARDAGKFDEYFGVWSAQEDEFYERENSQQLAQITIEN